MLSSNNDTPIFVELFTSQIIKATANTNNAADKIQTKIQVARNI